MSVGIAKRSIALPEVHLRSNSIKPLKLHWASSKPNFGDWLSPAICEYLSGRQIDHAKITACDLCAVGSILQRVKENFWRRKIHIWGSGFIQQESSRNTKHYVHALRGKHSASLFNNHSVTTFGDPGLLIGELLPDHQQHPEKKYRVGLIPHYNDRDHPLVAAINLPNTKVINVYQKPLDVAKEIMQCEFILSSSLHGLVIADAFSIPNQWLQLSNKVRGGGWKFHDYYSAFGLSNISPLIPSEEGLDNQEIEQLLGEYQRPNLDEIKTELINAFPFPKGRES